MSNCAEHKGLFCLFFPMICKWLLPPGVEGMLYVYLFDCVPLFLPNVLFFFSLFYLKHQSSSFYLTLLLFFDFCIGSISLFLNGSESFVSMVLGGSFYIPAFLVAINYSFYHKEKIFPYVFLPLLILTIQVFVFSTGIAHLKGEDLSNSFAGYLRIYTTAGAATGSSALIVMLGIICYNTARSEYMKIASLILSSVSSALLMSRMPFLCMLLFFIFIFTTKYIKSKKNAVFVLAVSCLLGIAGVFNPVMDRLAVKGDDTSGRDILIERSYFDFKGNELLGLGLGNIYATDEIKNVNIIPKYYGAPHNSYILLLFEQGCLGAAVFALFLLLLIVECWKINKKQTCVLILYLLTVYNTETIVLTNSEFVFLLAVYIMICRYRENYINGEYHGKQKNING